jgi:hypothetical protein
MRAAAEHFGIRVGRGGMVCCPFHNDRTPSMKLNDDYFYCFGCGATGDVIDFTAMLFHLSPKEAAEKLAADFSVAYEAGRGKPTAVRSRRSEWQRYQEAEGHCHRVLCRYLRLLMNWKKCHTPLPGETEWHPLYCEALQRESQVEYCLDEVFINGTLDDKTRFLLDHGKEVLALERRIQELDAGSYGADEPSR